MDTADKIITLMITCILSAFFIIMLIVSILDYDDETEPAKKWHEEIKILNENGKGRKLSEFEIYCVIVNNTDSDIYMIEGTNSFIAISKDTVIEGANMYIIDDKVDVITYEQLKTESKGYYTTITFRKKHQFPNLRTNHERKETTTSFSKSKHGKDKKQRRNVSFDSTEVSRDSIPVPQ